MDAKSFLEDTRRHELVVMRDEGVYRHIRFKDPATSAYYFDLITWPGHLCYTGDMGTFVFTRVRDMFDFFRLEPGRALDHRYAINPGYWDEKLVAVDGNRRARGATEFDVEKFRVVLMGYLKDWTEDGDLTDDEASELRAAVKDEVINRIEEQDESYTTHLAYEFEHTIREHSYQFQDLFDHSFHRHTDTFLWCCYALIWGIRQYDTHKAANPPKKLSFWEKAKRALNLEKSQ